MESDRGVLSILQTLQRVPSTERSQLATVVVMGLKESVVYYGPLFGQATPMEKLRLVRDRVTTYNEDVARAGKSWSKFKTFHEMLPPPDLESLDNRLHEILHDLYESERGDDEKFKDSVIYQAGKQHLIRLHTTYFLPNTRPEYRWTLGDTALGILFMMTSYQPLLRLKGVFGPLPTVFRPEMENAFVDLATTEHLYYDSNFSSVLVPLITSILMHLAF